MNQWRPRALAFSFAILAFVLLSSSSQDDLTVSAVFAIPNLLGTATAIVLLLAAVLLTHSSFDQSRTKAWLRLDWFLPAIRRIQGDENPSHSLLGRWLRRVMPNSIQSNHKTKKRGWFRRTIRKLGLSWSASPLRRLSQSICMIVFLILFLYVCWPYDARPVSDGYVSAGWKFHSIDQDFGHFTFRSLDHETEAARFALGETTFLVQTDADGHQETKTLGEFTVSARQSGRLTLSLIGNVAPETFDTLFSATDSFQLHERDPNAWPSHYTDNLARKEAIPCGNVSDHRSSGQSFDGNRVQKLGLVVGLRGSNLDRMHFDSAGILRLHLPARNNDRLF